MRLTILFFALCATALLPAQMTVETEAPVLAYKTVEETKAAAYDFTRYRERTLLGDLDLSAPLPRQENRSPPWSTMKGCGSVAAFSLLNNSFSKVRKEG